MNSGENLRGTLPPTDSVLVPRHRVLATFSVSAHNYLPTYIRYLPTYISHHWLLGYWNMNILLSLVSAGSDPTDSRRMVAVLYSILLRILNTLKVVARD